MEYILTNQNLLNFLFIVGFPLLGLKIFSLLLNKIFSQAKIEEFLVFTILSIVEIIISTIYLIRIYDSPNIIFTVVTILYILVINILYLFQNMDKTIKNKHSWADFMIYCFISTVLFVFYIAIITVNYLN